jgi:hypothetical protein
VVQRTCETNFSGKLKVVAKKPPYRIHPNVKHFDGREEVQGRPKTTTDVETLR